MKIIWLVILSILTLIGCDSDDPQRDGPKPVTKSNSMKIYMHYMPWYQSKPVSGYWGSHWRMSNQNPDIVDETGRRQIASHYYPLIGPYDSKDPDVIEYHLLLMKYAGVDAVLLDWYGSHNVNDYKPILAASNALIGKLHDVSLDFAIVYEEYTAEAVATQTGKDAITVAKEDLAYMESQYFTDDSYVRIDDKPLLLTFGPRYFRESSQWSSIFSELSQKPSFLPLWDHSALVGDEGNGEYAWVDFDTNLTQLKNFYNKTTYLEVLIGSAYPRFNDFYQEGGWGSGYGYIADADGQTLASTLDVARDRNARYLQLVTWNDFGEGTVLEPTLEDGFKFLAQIQEFTGVAYGVQELELVHQYYVKKQAYKNDVAVSEELAHAYQYLLLLEVDDARNIIMSLP